MALGELHRVLAVDGRLDLTVFEGAGTMISDDDFPGRFFAGWQTTDVADVLVGAGFVVDDLATPGEGDMRRIEVSATRVRTLADTVGPNMKLLCCGLNPSVYAADAGVAFARPGNRFWPAVREAGLTTVDRDTVRLLRDDAIGMTDLVKRATARADVLTPSEYRDGAARIERLCRRLSPKALCLIGLSGWRAAVDRGAAVGWQPEPLGGVPVYVMPSTSGANAHATPDALARHLRMAAAGP
jgi:TDG/mug DNA glycosylase family protein